MTNSRANSGTRLPPWVSDREAAERQGSFDHATMRTDRDPVDVSIGEFNICGLQRNASVGTADMLE